MAWQDVNLEEQCLTIRRSIRYDGSKRKYIIGPTKRKKVRVVDFGDTLAEILRNAPERAVKKSNAVRRTLSHELLQRGQREKQSVLRILLLRQNAGSPGMIIKKFTFVCLRPDGCLELPTTLGTVCRKVAKH